MERLCNNQGNIFENVITFDNSFTLQSHVCMSLHNTNPGYDELKTPWSVALH